MSWPGLTARAVSYQDFEFRVQDLVEINKMYSASEVNEEMMQSIREQVWQQMLSEKLMDKTYKKTGLGVSPDEVEMLVFGDNPHPIVQQLFTDPSTGAFNKSFLVNFLKATDEMISHQEILASSLRIRSSTTGLTRSL
ncbi:MAG: SurA N-terminal domain-containing protein [Bacteroidales bacterium]|nr:SurA N-terminal domain-containing protein [Bacteroidales bacterium]